MARRARVVVPGLPHHLTQRGNRQANVFIDDDDRKLYLGLLRDHSRARGVRIWDYTLMTNHVHLIVVPESETALSTTFRDTHAVYAAEFNKKYELSGHLWQARFYSCALDDVHLWAAVRYVERNPVRAGIVARAEDYRWSGAFAHVHGVEDPMLDDGLPLIGVVRDWSAWLAVDDEARELSAIREATQTGRPLGHEEFIARLEAELDRPLAARRRGPKSRLLTGSNHGQGSLL